MQLKEHFRNGLLISNCRLKWVKRLIPFNHLQLVNNRSIRRLANTYILYIRSIRTHYGKFFNNVIIWIYDNEASIVYQILTLLSAHMTLFQETRREFNLEISRQISCRTFLFLLNLIKYSNPKPTLVMH